MSNLVQQYGDSWFNSRFNSTFFLLEDKPARVIEAVSRNAVRCAVLHKEDNGTIVAEEQTLPASVFPDSSVFSVPELGYRHARNGAVLTFLRRNNTSYVRGLSSRNLQTNHSSITRLLTSRGLTGAALSANELNYMAMKPEFIPLMEGIGKVLNGDLISFAASPTVAVVPSPTSPNTLAILFCGKSVGNVDANGNLRINSPITSAYIEALNDQ